MRVTHYQNSGLLLLAALLGSTLSWAQSPGVVINDLTFVLRDGAGPSGNRSQLRDALLAFSERHALGVSLTTLLEDDPYQEAARQQEDQRLQQTTPVLVITAWYDKDTKARRRTQVQVNEAMASRLPQATAEQITTEALDYYRTNPLSDDALMQGMRLALHRLNAYLDGLPSAGEVPTITFANPSATDPPPLGLDQMRYPAHQGNYTQLKIKQTDYPVAWKALPSNQPTTVLAQVDKELSFPPGLVFRQNGNALPAQPSSENYQQRLRLTGQAHRQEGEVTVYASAEENAELVGQLNTISYDALYQKLVLVPLNRRLSREDLLPLVDRVATIYRQAAVNLEVDVSEPVMIADWTWDHALEDGTTGLLSNYTAEMRQVIRALRQQQDTDKKTAYIFLCYQGASQPAKEGYMPKKRQYGFVFDEAHHDDKALAATIAHELGHGLFRLEHSWQTYPALSKGSSDNLMDYRGGTNLHKYQWDLIHDPVGMLGWFQDEEENALDACFWAKSLLKYNALFGEEHPLQAAMPRFEEVRDNFDTYWQQSKALFDQHRFGNDKQNNLALNADAAWTIRNASHYQKDDATFFVDLAIKRLVEQQPRVQLHPEGVTLAKIILEGVPFRVALYSTEEHADPDYIRVDELCALVDTKEVQVLIEDGQLLIAYMNKGQAEIVLQVLSDDWDHGALWLRYLGIYVAKDSEVSWLSTIPKFWEDWTWGGGGADEEKQKKEPTLPVTTEQLKEIFPNTDQERVEEVVEAINSLSNEFEINTEERMAHFLGQIGTETGGLVHLNELDNYSPRRVVERFGRPKYADLFQGYDSDPTQCVSVTYESDGSTLGEGKPGPVSPTFPYTSRQEICAAYASPAEDVTLANFREKVTDKHYNAGTLKVKSKHYGQGAQLFDVTYACRMGNAGPSSGDGSKYKGKGFIHLTGRYQYKLISQEWNKKYPNDQKAFHGEDINLLETDVKVALKASLLYWNLKGLNQKADEGFDNQYIDAITYKVNGGYNEKELRRSNTNAAKNALHDE